MARFGRTKTHAPIIRHGRVPPLFSVNATFSVSYEITLGVSKTESVPYESRETYANLILRDTGLVSYWRLGEASGNALDSKDSNPGTTVAGGITRQANGLIINDSDKAVQGDGVLGTHIIVPYATNMNVGAQLTVECWVNITNYVVSRYIISRNSGSTCWFLTETSNTGYRWYVRDSNFVDTIINTSNTIVVGARQHLVGVYDAAGTMKLYVNGISVGTPDRTPNANVQNSVGQALHMLGQPSVSAGMTGTLDEVSFYNRALSAAEVLERYNLGNAGTVDVSATFSLPYESLAKVAGVAVPYDTLILSESGLRAYWPLDETAGTTADDINGTYDGTYSGGYTLNQTGAGSGTGKSVALNGTTGYIALPSSTPDLSGGGPATFEAWVRTNDYTINQFIYGGYDNSPFNGFGVQFGNPSLTPGKIGYWSNLSPSGWVGSTTLITDTNWHHIVVVYDSSVVTFYIDGVAAGTATAGPPTANSNIKAIGSYFGGGSTTLNGAIDAVALYDVALSAAQVLNHYNNGNQTVSVGATFSLPYESRVGLATVSQTFTLPYEAITGVSTTASVAYESNVGLSATAVEPYEARFGLAATTSVAYEANSGLSATAVEPIEARTAFAATTAVAYESNVGIVAVTASQAYEANVGISAITSVVYESRLGLAATTLLSYESNLGMSAQSSLSYEVYSAFSATTSVALEALLGISHTDSFPYEAAAGTIPVSQTYALSYESNVGISDTDQQAYEALGAVSALAQESYESLFILSNPVAVAYEVLVNVTDTDSFPYEATVGTIAVSQTFSLAYESNVGISATNVESVEAQAALSIQTTVAYESLLSLSQTISEPVEINVGVSLALAPSAYEILLGLTQTTALPYETYSVLSLTTSVAYEALVSVSDTDSWPYEILLGTVPVSATFALPYESREPYAGLILRTSGLVSYWRVGEASGALLDSKSTNHATTVTGGITRQAPGLLVGDANGAIRGDGVIGTYTDVPANANLTTSIVSVECWAKPTALPGTTISLIDKFAVGGYILGYNAGVWRWLARPTSGSNVVLDTSATPASNPQIGVRHHIVGTYSVADGSRLYINGAQVANASAVNTLGVTDAIQFLADGAAAASFPGTLDEISIYNTVLSPAQVLDHYNLGMQGLVDVSATSSLPLESLKSISATFSLAVEAPVGGISQTASLPYEARTGVASQTAAAYESLLGLTQTTSVPYEAQQKVNVSAPVSTPYEVLLGVSLVTASNPYEALLRISSANSFPYESYVPGFVFATTAMSIESVANVSLALDADPYEVLVGAIRQTLTQPYEALSALSALTIQSLEALAKLQAPAELSYETLLRLAALSSAPLDIPGSAQALFLTQYEALLTLAAAITLPYDSEQGVIGISALAELPLDSLGQIALQRALTYEVLVRLSAATLLPYEFQRDLLAISVLRTLPYDSLLGTYGIAILPIESIMIGSFPGRLPGGHSVYAVTGTLVTSAQNGGPRTTRTGRIRRPQTGKVTK